MEDSSGAQPSLTGQILGREHLPARHSAFQARDQGLHTNRKCAGPPSLGPVPMAAVAGQDVEAPEGSGRRAKVRQLLTGTVSFCS